VGSRKGKWYKAGVDVAEIVGNKARVFGRSGVAGFLPIVITAYLAHSDWLKVQSR
jgi:hypothetical protein